MFTDFNSYKALYRSYLNNHFLHINTFFSVMQRIIEYHKKKFLAVDVLAFH